MAVTLPFDTARTRILLDNTKSVGSKGTVAYIFQLAQEEGVYVPDPEYSEVVMVLSLTVLANY